MTIMMIMKEMTPPEICLQHRSQKYQTYLALCRHRKKYQQRKMEMEECRPEMVAVPEVVQVVTADNPGSARVESVWMIYHRPFKP